MKTVSKLAAVALVAASAFAASTASAAIACNRVGHCWHTTAAYTYRPAWGVVVHEDSWKWGPRDHYRWREHEGRGYWRGNRWITF
jgi:hypothetical protein